MVSNDGSSSYVPEHKTRDRQLQALASRNDISASFVLGDSLGAPMQSIPRLWNPALPSAAK
jgi:hypothetical protein